MTFLESPVIFRKKTPFFYIQDTILGGPASPPAPPTQCRRAFHPNCALRKDVTHRASSTNRACKWVPIPAASTMARHHL